MNEASRFSLTCDELVRAIKLNNRSRAYELIERLRAIFAHAFGGPEVEDE
jgi:hypothetical protein